MQYVSLKDVAIWELYRVMLHAHRYHLFIYAKLDPLRAELAKITRENNILHGDLVDVQTTSSAREKRAQQISKTQKQDYEELKFVNSQLLHAMDTIKNKSEGDRRRMEDALQRHGIVGDKGGDKRAIDVDAVLQKLQKIDIETVGDYLIKRDLSH
jgi:hypothetical protein